MRRPPALAERLLGRVVPHRLRDSLLGDLHEEFGLLAARRPRAAALWYWRETLALAARFLPGRAPTAPGHGGTGGGGDGLGADLRFGWRRMRRRPAFAVVSIVTLALGVGAAGAIFTVVNNVLLRPLPYADAAQLVRVWRTIPEWRADPQRALMWNSMAVSFPEYREWRAGHAPFTDLGAWRSTSVVLAAAGDTRLARVTLVSASLLPMLGLHPAHGRGFLPGDDAPGAAPQVLLAWETWVTRHGADTAILGRTVQLDGESHTVVGIMPRGVRIASRFDEVPEYWLPAGRTAFDNERGNRGFSIAARLGSSLSLADAERAAAARFETFGAGSGARVEPMADDATRPVRAPLLLLLAAAAGLLIVAAANVATVLVGAAAARAGEVATRLALGASPRRLARQFFAEGAALALIGCAAGLALARLAAGAFVRYAPDHSLRLASPALDPRVLLAALAVAALATLAFGLAPLVGVSASQPGAVLRGSGPRSGARGSRLLHAGLALQLAWGALLVAGTLLVSRGFQRLLAVDPGFRTDSVLVVQLAYVWQAYPELARYQPYFDGLRARVAAVPGVLEVAGISAVPLADGGSGTSILVERAGREPLEADAQFRTVTPGALELLAIPIVAGRSLQDGDHATAPRVVVVSETFARQFWPDATALGQRVRIDNQWHEVVGVAGDVRHRSLAGRPDPTYYLAQAQSVRRPYTLVVRTGVAPATLVPAIRQAVADVNAAVPIARAEPLVAGVGRALAPDRYRVAILGFFAAAALLIAGVGVAGAAAQASQQREREMAIRSALGASPGRIMRLVLRNLGLLALAGGVGGAVMLVVLRRLLAPFLYGLAPLDPPSLVGAPAAMLTLVLAASWWPTRRLRRLDPARLLGTE